MSELIHNRVQFERAIERLILAADQSKRGDDLDRVVGHLTEPPADVSRLAALLMLVDEDVRPELSAAISAFRRFRDQQGDTTSDDDVFGIMRDVYGRVRA